MIFFLFKYKSENTESMSGYLLLIIWVALSTLIHPSSYAQGTAPLIVSFWHVCPSGLPDQRRSSLTDISVLSVLKPSVLPD